MVLPHDTRRGIPRRSGYRKWRTESTDTVPWARLLKGSQSGRSVPAGSKAAGTRPNGSGSCSRQAEVRQSGAVRETSLRRKRVIRRLLQAGQYHEPRWVAGCVLHHGRLHRRGAQVDAESDRRYSHGRGDQRRYPLRRRRPLPRTSPGTEVPRRDLA